MNEKPNFIDLPNGDFVSLNSVRAIRLAKPGPIPFDSPSVRIEFDVGNSVVFYCESIEERNKLAEELKAKLR